jgi:glycosyltransferase involved in cell wall biosynthesis
MRGDLMEWGRQQCDGVLDADHCTRCRLHSLGMPRPLAGLVAQAPSQGFVYGKRSLGPLRTALGMRNLVERQHSAVRTLWEQVDCVVALSAWTRRLLMTNGVDAHKIAFIPHGVDAPVKSGEHRSRPRGAPLAVVSLGRLEPAKGIGMLVDALSHIRGGSISLDIYGISQSKTESPFEQQLRRQVARDARIRLLPPVDHSQIVPVLSNYDLLAVPSQWQETGPLVVLEAFSAGIPVVGSNLGGIAEKVQDGVNGLLVDPRDERGWSATLARLANDRDLVERLKANVQAPRPMRQVVTEMLDVYARVRAARTGTPAVV